MSDVRFKLNLPGLNELMKSAPMQAVINEAAAQIAGSAGESAQIETAHPIGFIAIGSVSGSKKDNGLEKAMGGAKI